MVYEKASLSINLELINNQLYLKPASFINIQNIIDLILLRRGWGLLCT